MPVSDLISAAATVFLDTDGLAVEIVRWPKGNKVYAEPVAAIFKIDPTSKIETHGVSYMTKASMKLAVGQAYDLKDKYIHDGDTWTIEAPGKRVGGLQNFKMKIHERSLTKQRGG